MNDRGPDLDVAIVPPGCRGTTGTIHADEPEGMFLPGPEPRWAVVRTVGPKAGGNSMDAIREILNQERADKSVFCECDACKSVIGKAVTIEDWCCKNCGYDGRPRAMDCICYDHHCGGVGLNSLGSGCTHGILICPVCDDGEGDVDPWEIVREIRAAMREAAEIQA